LCISYYNIPIVYSDCQAAFNSVPAVIHSQKSFELGASWRLFAGFPSAPQCMWNGLTLNRSDGPLADQNCHIETGIFSWLTLLLCCIGVTVLHGSSYHYLGSHGHCYPTDSSRPKLLVLLSGPPSILSLLLCFRFRETWKSIKDSAALPMTNTHMSVIIVPMEKYDPPISVY
jgi:hypothetical protein